MSKFLKNALFGVIGVLGVSAVQAAPISSWQVTVATVFDTTSILPTSGITAIGNTELRWGIPVATNGPQSGLKITDTPSTKTVFTNGPAVANVTVTHFNQPIYEPSLSAVTMLSSLTLVPNALNGTQTIPFGIKFLETTNDPGGNDICADGTGRYSEPLNTNGCADIFVISQNALNFQFFYDDPDSQVLQRPYFISFFELTSGLNPLPAAACTATGASAGCLGFRTPEKANTPFQFAAVITTEPVSVVPEPGVLALMGLGFGLMGLLNRRRRTS